MTSFTKFVVLLFAVLYIPGCSSSTNLPAKFLLFSNFQNKDQNDLHYGSFLERSENRSVQENTEEPDSILGETNYMNDGFVYVEGGTFAMGSNIGNYYENPVHRVKVNSFFIGKYEVTQKEWEEIMGNNPSRFKGANLPVEKVSWDDIQEFIEKLNQKTGGNYRLLTEAEWEYAARGGNTSKGYTYSGSNNIDDVAWWAGNSRGKTHPVGTKQPNELGIYDMTGNVWEWCSDWFGDDYYKNGPKNNPQGPSSGEDKLRRGGSWDDDFDYYRVAHRDTSTPDGRYTNVGFRLCRGL